MTESVPHDGISAFFDEELSASELKDVSHHLSRSAAAQSELADIRRLSEELRSLPRGPSPSFLASEVMNRIQGPCPRTSVDPHESQPRRRAIGAIMAAALALVLTIASFPSLWKPSAPNEQDSTALGRVSGEDDAQPFSDNKTQATSPEESRAKQPATRHLGSEGDLLAQGTRSRMLPKADASPAGGMGGFKPGSDSPAPQPAPLQMGIASATSPERLIENGEKLNVGDPEFKALMDFRDGPDDRVAIVEIRVEDPQSAFEQLQTLLAQNAVNPVDWGLGKASKESKRKAAEGDSAVALFVQSTPEQLAGALQGLREQQPVSQWNAITNLSVGEILLKHSEDDKAQAKDENDEGKAHSLAQALAEYESAQVGQKLDGKSPDRAPRAFSAGAEAGVSNKPTRATKSPEGEEKRPAAASQELDMFMRPALPSEGQNRQAGRKSFQVVLETARTPLQEKPADDAEAPAAKKQGLEIQQNQSNLLVDRVQEPAETPVKELPAPKPIRTLFLFRTAVPPATKSD